jgi:Ni/Co efflux regulator RcnB
MRSGKEIQMKRPVPFVLLASLLLSASALAANGSEFKDKLTGKIARAERNEQRGNDHRNDNRGGNTRGNGHGNNDRGRDHGNGPGSNGTRPGGDVSVHRDYRGYHDRNNRDHDRNDHRDDHRRDGDGRRDGRNDRDRHDYNGNHGRGNDWSRYRSDWNRHPHYWDNRRHDRHDYARYRYHMGHYHRPHGYYHHTWYRGHYLPRGWYGSSYIIHDWHPYRLYAPPYGYAWVRVGNDVLLTALATGLVLDVIYDIWY